MTSWCLQQNLSFNFLIGRTTVSKIAVETCAAVYEALAPIYLRPPNRKEEWKEISDQYMETWNMPHVMGALDSKHIALDCPKGSVTQEYNYKEFYSLFQLAIYGAKYNFTMVDVGQQGSNIDSGVVINSETGQNFEESSFDFPESESLEGCPVGQLPYYLVGNDIFPLKLWLMQPYPGQLSEEKMVFSYRLYRARLIIENTFSILVARWRIFRGPISYLCLS